MAKARRGHGEGSITQLPDGRWQARVDLGYINGKRVRKAYFGKTRVEAARKLNQALANKERGLPPIPERLTLVAFLDRWLANSVKQSVRPNTFVSYEYICRVHLIPRLGRIRLAQLTPNHVRACLRQV